MTPRKVLLVGLVVGLSVWGWWANRQTVQIPEVVTSACAGVFQEAPAFDPGRAPDGWSSLLRVDIDGEPHAYGLIPAHYWRLADDDNLLCGLHYNTDLTSAADQPDGILLYVVEGVMTSLPMDDEDTPQPEAPQRVHEVLLADAPDEWQGTAPAEPGYVYWRSLWHPSSRAAVSTGYWLRHVAIRSFTFDHGDPDGDYPFLHQVEPGPDSEFAPKIVFDAGP